MSELHEYILTSYRDSKIHESRRVAASDAIEAVAAAARAAHGPCGERLASLTRRHQRHHDAAVRDNAHAQLDCDDRIGWYAERIEAVDDIARLDAMDIDQYRAFRDFLIATGQALYGKNWQTPLARDLDETPLRTVQRWASGERSIRDQDSLRRALVALLTLRSAEIDALLRRIRS